MPRVNLPGRHLVSSKDVLPASIAGVGRRFGRNKSGLKEARMTVTFTSANVPINIVHNLGFVPSGWNIVTQDRAGSIYNNTNLMSSSRSLILLCDTAGTVAEIVIK